MLHSLFHPRSVALVGASSSPEKLGFLILKNLVQSEFKGEVYPVNPHASEILKTKTYASISDIKDPVDLVLIAIPSDGVCDIVEECAKKNIKNVVIISAGFKEIGGEGIEREKKLVELIHQYQLHMVGPNCLGIINSHIDMNASFSEGMPRKGKIALLSQSGAMAVAITDWAEKANVGFSKIVSLGNKAGIDENIFLEYLENDPETEVIMLYLESFSDGKKFMELASRIALKKPILLFKSGTSEAGSKAVTSHTGALAGSDTAVAAAMNQCGVLRARAIEDFFYMARIFSMQPLPLGNRIAVITNAGGPGVITTDVIAKSSYLKLAHFDPETTKKLKISLPVTANIHNPVDIVGDALADRYQKALNAILPDKNVDMTLVILTPQIMTQKENTAHILMDFNNKYPQKTLVASFMGGKNIEYAADILAQNNIPNFIYPNRAVKCMEKMVFLKTWREQKQNQKREKILNKKIDQLLKKEISKLSCEKKIALPQNLVAQLLKNYEISIPQIKLAQTVQEAVQDAEKMGYPVVLKVSSEQILHKTDSGCVRLDLHNKEDVRKGFEDILKNGKKNCPKAKIDGVLVQKMYHLGREVIIGMKRDPVFGPLIMFGLGGIYVEVMKDVSFRVAPFSYQDALSMIHEVKAIQLLEGVRGEAASDIETLAQTVMKIGQLSLDVPEILELDINPLLVFEKGAVALDSRFLL